MDSVVLDDNEPSLLSFGLEIIIYLTIGLVILLIAPSFIIYPGIYMGRYKSRGPIFELETKDNAKIEGMIFEPDNPETCDLTILFFHGNTGNMGSRVEFLKNLNETLNAYILSIDYRGFGNNSGFPSESGLINDAESIFDSIVNDERMKDTKKLVYGRSLGGAVAIALAEKLKDCKNPKGCIDGLILENTFTSTRCMADSMPLFKKFPGFIIDIGLSVNSWKSKDRIKDIKIPVLYISGLKDRVVHPKLMKELYDSCGSKTKLLLEEAEGEHTNTHLVSDQYYVYLKKLIKLL